MSGSRFAAEAKIPEYLPPVILFTPRWGSRRAASLATPPEKFGPFKNQMFVGDQTFSTVMRCYLEEGQRPLSGACFNFRAASLGNLSARVHTDGSLFVGGTGRGWGSRGTKPFSIERMNWTGRSRSRFRRCTPARMASSWSSRSPSIRRPLARPSPIRCPPTPTSTRRAGSPEVDPSGTGDRGRDRQSGQDAGRAQGEGTG